MRGHPFFGVFLALGAVLILTPDALLMRLSGMEAGALIAWRGLLSGAVFLGIWLVSRATGKGGGVGQDIKLVFTLAGATVVVCHGLNALLFSAGIAIAPVSVVLFGVATVPVFAALFSRMIMGEVADRRTWTATGLVLAGIGFAVFGDGLFGDTVSEDGAHDGLATALGALAGLGVAMALAMTFVTLRHNRQTPLALAIGIGAVLSGLTGFAITGFSIHGPRGLLDGAVWAIAITGLLILPITFFSLPFASRHTSATNVSLILLLETVLAPVWVWVGIGEAPTTAMMIGGAVVLATVGLYLVTGAKHAP